MGNNKKKKSTSNVPKSGGPVVEHPEAPSDISRPTRTKVPSKTLNEEEVNAERAVHAKHQRAGHVGELRKRRKVMQDLITGPGVHLPEVEDAVERYEEAFHNFVSSHENYLRYEVDEEMRALMIDSYDNQRDLKLQLDVLVNDWRAKRKELERPPSESGLSLKSAKSVKSYASSGNNLKERKRLMEEAKLEMQSLKEKQELQRELEEIEKGKAELSRKLELLDAKTKVQRTEMELMLEQSGEEETDGMNDYLKEYYMQNQLKKELSLQPDELSVTPNSEAQPANGQETVTKGLPTVNGAQSQFVLPSAQKSLGTESVITLSSVSHTVQVAKNEESINCSTSVTPTYCMDGMITSCLSSHLPYSKTTPIACTPNSIQLPIYTHASLSPVITQSTPGLFTRLHVPHATSLRAAATEFSPAITSQWTMPSPSQGPSLLSQS